MGYWASARLTYGYDVTGQSPEWFDSEDMDDFGEYGSGMLRAVHPDTYVHLIHDDYTGDMVIAAVEKYQSCSRSGMSATVIESLDLPAGVVEELAWAAELLGFYLSGQKPVWRLSSQFS